MEGRSTFFSIKKLRSFRLRGKIAIVGIAKRLEEIYFPQDPIPLYLDKKSESLKVIQYLRNEAHRFGITFHRNKRSKGAIRSGLDTIPGVGPKTKESLLKKFKSFKRIKDAALEDLITVLGEKGETVASTFALKNISVNLSIKQGNPNRLFYKLLSVKLSLQKLIILAVCPLEPIKELLRPMSLPQKLRRKMHSKTVNGLSLEFTMVFSMPAGNLRNSSRYIGSSSCVSCQRLRPNHWACTLIF